MNGSPHPSRQSRIDYIFVSAGLAAACLLTAVVAASLLLRADASLDPPTSVQGAVQYSTSGLLDKNKDKYPAQ